MSRTPYNSIYEPLKLNIADGNGGQQIGQQGQPMHKTCCLHGVPCQTRNQVDRASDENQYVNLAAPTAEQKMAECLVKKLARISKDEQTAMKSKTDVESLDHVMSSANDTVPSPTSSKRKRREKKANTEDERQNYYNLGESREDTKTTQSTLPTESSFSQRLSSSLANSSKSCDNEDEKLKQNQPYSPVVKSSAASIYLGACSRKDAELQVLEPTTFCLYHEYHVRNINMLSDGLPLILIYKTAKGGYRHYPIRTTSMPNGDMQYFVDYGVGNVRKHWSLNQLVKFYQIHASFHPNDDELADIFSYWND